METEATVNYWNARAVTLGEKAGSQDLIAAELERRAIARHVKDGMRVLDVGCGTGQTALWLARQYQIGVHGFDQAELMVEAALGNRDAAGVYGLRVGFSVGDVLTADFATQYDLIYSTRCLINLPDWPTQAAAIRRILSWLRPGGTYLAVECSQDGLNELNALRASIGLPAIVPPSHNRYLRDQEMRDLGYCLADDGVGWLMNVEAVASTYSLLSRLVNAHLAQEAGVPPAYDAPVNRLALSLPNIGQLGQNRCWQFVRQGRS